MIHYLKQKIISSAGAATGTASVLGSWQICHNICIGIVALLGMIGITVVGFPLLFLTKIALPIWIAAVVLLAISFALYFKKRCISGKLIVANTGLIIAGTPFSWAQKSPALFWAAGGTLVLCSILLYVKDKLNRRN